MLAQPQNSERARQTSAPAPVHDALPVHRVGNLKPAFRRWEEEAVRGGWTLGVELENGWCSEGAGWLFWAGGGNR